MNPVEKEAEELHILKGKKVKMSTFEYRKLFRTNIILKVAYKTVNKPQVEGIAFSKHISSTGVNIVMADKLERETKLELQVYLPVSENPVFAKGEITWQADCSYVPDSQRQYYSTGIQFNYMSNDDAIKTSDFIREILKNHSEAESKKIIEMIEGLGNK